MYLINDVNIPKLILYCSVGKGRGEQERWAGWTGFLAKCYMKERTETAVVNLPSKWFYKQVHYFTFISYHKNEYKHPL